MKMKNTKSFLDYFNFQKNHLWAKKLHQASLSFRQQNFESYKLSLIVFIVLTLSLTYQSDNS